ncbi:MAG: hypothetical protein DMD34_06175 [Gemmatimonadetes bacterium]|nr:MAG: hypothetical protein DMD46_12660 [Gemmatimonadota bacterium]PYP95879.1 MAG: hypothetical protein DMD34_06175 [Gemmatimonadota bacterium]
MRTQTSALVLAVGRGTTEVTTPGPRFRLAAGDVLVIVGQPAQLVAATTLVGLGGVLHISHTSVAGCGGAPIPEGIPEM